MWRIGGFRVLGNLEPTHVEDDIGRCEGEDDFV